MRTKDAVEQIGLRVSDQISAVMKALNDEARAHYSGQFPHDDNCLVCEAHRRGLQEGHVALMHQVLQALDADRDVDGRELVAYWADALALIRTNTAVANAMREAYGSLTSTGGRFT